MGPKTWSALNKATAPKPPPPASSGGSGPTLREGARGEPVRALQNRLNQLGFNVGAADGSFGPKTEAAVKAFQKARGLTADGIVGPKTWDKLGIKPRRQARLLQPPGRHRAGHQRGRHRHLHL